MSLTGRPVYQKGQSLKKQPNRPSAEQRRLWDRIVHLGCIVANGECRGRTTVHHTGTGLGYRKDHGLVLPLCEMHHLGERGIDGKRISKREWERVYGSEELLLARVGNLLGARVCD